ncbi:MAG TPA: maleylpyruvate isomerase N-terminal domain-containing protein [Actinomycetota bacterium]|nr:maleylpyruvate isomerase N-terminal domain-containing protein [Actinomycetota bacterium]
MDPARLLEEEDRGWLELTELFGDVPPGRFEEPSLNVEGWTPKDAMFHVARWAEEATTVLRRIAAGTHREADLDTDRINQEWLEQGRDLDADLVRLRFAKGRTAMRQAFESLPEVDPLAWEWFDESGPRHYAEHLPDLRSFLERGTDRQ